MDGTDLLNMIKIVLLAVTAVGVAIVASNVIDINKQTVANSAA